MTKNSRNKRKERRSIVRDFIIKFRTVGIGGSECTKPPQKPYGPDVFQWEEGNEKMLHIQTVASNAHFGG